MDSLKSPQILKTMQTSPMNRINLYLPLCGQCQGLLLHKVLIDNLISNPHITPLAHLDLELMMTNSVQGGSCGCGKTFVDIV